MPAGPHPIVGVWTVTAPDAPFARHVFLFHADGTMLQSNPEAGNAATSDSVGMGVWRAAAGAVRGRFAEVSADRATRAPAGDAVVAFTIEVDGDRFTGTADATFRDVHGALRSGPHTTSLEGQRLTTG